MTRRMAIGLTLGLLLAVCPGTANAKRRGPKPKRLAPLSMPVRNMPVVTSPSAEPPHDIPVRHRIPPHLRRYGAQSAVDSREDPTPTSPLSSGPLTATTAGPHFEGLGLGFPSFNTCSGGTSTCVAPPDTNGAVGRTQYVQLVNSSFVVFDKVTRTVIAGPTLTNNLWANLPQSNNPCKTTNDGDGIVLYDHLADRWLITQFANALSSTGPYYECVAVSQTADAAGAYFLYFFSYSEWDGTILDFNDYPKFGVWPDAYYASYNMFLPNNGSSDGGMVCALDRTKMLLGAATLRGQPGPAGTASTNPANTPAGENQICFQTNDFGLLPSDLDGATPPPAGSPNYYVEWYDLTDLGLWKFHVDFDTPTNSTLNGIHWVAPFGPNPTTLAAQMIPVAAFTPTCSYWTTGHTVCVPQPGVTQKLDTLTDRLMFRLAYRNFGNHESLVTNHTVASGTSSGIRWYELQDPNGTPTVAQTGTWAPTTGDWRWMGSAAMDKFGNIAIGYSVSNSTTIPPSIRYADPKGLASDEAKMFDGPGSQTGNSLDRWGDYSALTLDPQDDCTFWYTNEYIPSNGSFNWHTEIGSFTFPQCQTTPASVSVTPDSGAGNTQTFSFLYSDTGGASKLFTVSGLINGSNSLTNACAFQYFTANNTSGAPTNTLQIYTDAGAPGGTLTPGSGTVSNSQCTINGGGTSVATAGNSLVLNVSITFTTPAFDGSKNIYSSVEDSHTSTSFQQFGTWTVQ